jgi:hypothetical protein
MKIKPLSLIILAIVLLLDACSPMTISTPLGKQPTPMIDTIATSDYQAVQVNQLDIDMGMGSPDPIQIIVRGTLPDICAQVEYTELKQDGTNFKLNIFTLASTPVGCTQDPIPFMISLPINVANLNAGTYSVEINGVDSATIMLDNDNPVTELHYADDAIVKEDILVDEVKIDIGFGSPTPVNAVVSGTLPNACAQLGEIHLNRDGKTFFARLVAVLPTRADCDQDNIPFRIEIPLSTINLPESTYEVDVNGMTTSFVPPAALAPSEPGIDEKTYFEIEHVEVQIGKGSPLPVEIVASGTWPDLCAQIADVHSMIKDFKIDVTILATTAPTCRPDYLGLPFLFKIPLNIGEMPAGTYTISVNGTSTTLDLPIFP